MDKKQIGAKLVMDDLHLPFEIDQFDDRLILQKAIYLAQATGVDLGYYYRWYLHGPYCPALAKDGFAIKVELEQKIDESKRWHLDESSANKLDRLRPLLAESDRRALSRKLELLASVHFLVDRGQVPARHPKEIVTVLKRFEKDFDEQEVQEALDDLETHGALS